MAIRKSGPPYRKATKRTQKKLGLESLEARQLLAGDVLQPIELMVAEDSPPLTISMEQFTDLILRQDIAEVPGPGEMVFLGALPENTQVVQSHNTFAADTTNADQLQPGGTSGLNLTGEGYSVGVWDGGHVRGTHQDFAGNRVSYIDVSQSNPLEFKNHGTHVAGTIGATGEDFPFGNAEGMATEVNIRSGDWDSDIDEMASEASNIVASNHSYGLANGWETSTDDRAPGGPFVTTTGVVDVWWGDRSQGLIEDAGFGRYTNTSRNLDNVIHENPTLLSVWSAGNDRNDAFGNASNQNTYVTQFSEDPGGIGWTGPGFYLVGNGGATVAPLPEIAGGGFDLLSAHQVAKNTLVVGAVEDLIADPYSSSDIQITSFSSYGSTDDGRIKPDVVGNGAGLWSTGADADDHYYSTSGTSMSAPNVTGSAVLLIEHYNNEFNESPLAATSKAILIHTAADAGNFGPDYAYGWGLVDVAAAADLVTDAATSGADASVQELNFSDDQTQSHIVRVDSGGQLKATIAWTDLPGSPVANGGLDDTTSMLVNDLDLLVIGPDGQQHHPWTLDVSAPSTTAVRTTSNHVDNVEQVLLDFAAPGDYVIQIGSTGTVADQDFSLVIEGGVLEPDANDQISEAAQIAVGQSTSGFSVGEPTDVDLFEFNVSDGQAVGFDIDLVSGNLDALVRVFDASGNEIGVDDDGRGPEPETSDLDSYFEYRFENAGTYYVGVSDFRNTDYDINTGNGDSTISQSTGEYTLITTDFGTDDNGTIATAMPLAFGQPNNETLDPSVDLDFWSLAAASGEEVSFQITDTGFFSHLRIFDGSGTELAATRDDDFSFVFPATGTYYVGISEINAVYDPLTGVTENDNVAEVGSYVLLAERASDPLMVTTTSDDVDSADGVVSLREAVAFANSNLGPDTITFSPILTGQTINVTEGHLVVNESLTIDGLGQNELVVSGDHSSRLFDVLSGTSQFSVEDITLRDGGTPELFGGAIQAGSLTTSVSIIRSRLTSNESNSGGAINATGMVSIVDSVIDNNDAAANGGGINVVGGTLDITNSTISSNHATNGGGGINANNTATTILSSTVAFNDSPNGGGVEFFGTTGTVRNSIFSDNTATNNGPDILGGVDANFSLISNPFGAGLTGTSANNITGQSAILGALAGNGGATLTHALLDGSPAINAADPALSGGSDQTGNPRVVGGVADMGAVEANPAVVRTLGSLAQGATSETAYNLRADEVIFYRIELDADVLAANGDSLVIDTLGSNLGTSNDTELGLYDAAGNRVADNDDIGNPNFLSQLRFGDNGVDGDLSAGTYYVSLSAFNTAFGESGFDVTSVSENSGDIVVNFDLNNGGNSLVCDFNSDSQCNGADIDMLQANIVTGPVNPAIFDLTGDGQVTIADRNEWLILAGATNLASGNAYLSGDANLDGSVDVSDFNVWNSNKFSATSAWTSGDFNADGSVDVSDFNAWNSNKFQSADSARSSAVPTLQPATAFASELGSDLDKDSDREQDNANLLDIVFGDWS